jgi:hypothetical protein
VNDKRFLSALPSFFQKLAHHDFDLISLDGDFKDDLTAQAIELSYNTGEAPHVSFLNEQDEGVVGRVAAKLAEMIDSGQLRPIAF